MTCSKGGALISAPLYTNLQVSEGELNKNKGISKCHNMDEKSTNFAVHVPSSIIGFFN